MRDSTLNFIKKEVDLSPSWSKETYKFVKTVEENFKKSKWLVFKWEILKIIKNRRFLPFWFVKVSQEEYNKLKLKLK